MANTTEFWKAFNDRLLFYTLRESVVQALCNPSWFSELQRGARDFRISRVNADGVAVRDVTEDQVAAASNFNTATLTGQDVTRNIFEGTAQTRMLEVFETRVGSALVRDVMMALRTKLALHLDNKAMASVVAGSANGLDLGKVGGTGANGVGISISYKGIVGRGTSANAAAEAAFIAEIADLTLRMQEYWQDQNLRGVVVGDGAPVSFAMITLPGVAAAIQRSEFAFANGFRQASDVGAELLTTLNLMGGMGSFRGMLHDTAIYTVTPSADAGALNKPAAADGDWPAYFLPVGSAVAFNSHIWRSDRIPGPLEDGSYLDRWISVGRYAVENLKEAHIGKATVNASA